MKALTIAILAAAVLVAVAGYAAAQPFWSDPAVARAMDSGDYNAFVTAKTNAQNARFNERFSEERFNQMRERQQQMTAAQEALEAGDYDAWVEAHKNVETHGRGMMMDSITEDNFDTFVKMHQAMEDGDTELAQTYAEELGLNPQKGLGFGEGRGFGEHGFGGCMQ